MTSVLHVLFSQARSISTSKQFCLANALSIPHKGGLDKVLSIDEPVPQLVLCSAFDGIERATNLRSVEANSSIKRTAYHLL